MKNKKPKYYFLFKIIRGIVKFIYPKIEIVNKEFLQEPCVIVGNHAQLYGPLIGELHFPENTYIWCESRMMNLKEVPEYAFMDFWSQKPRYIRWFYKMLSYIIAPIAVVLFNCARTIPVYRNDMRIINTFRKTSRKLQKGNSVIIFPEHNIPYNNVLWEFQESFINVAKFHYKHTGQEISFAPMYIAPKLKKVFIGEPIKFDSSAPFEEEQKRILKYLMDKITETAQSLPEHTVVPYPNIPKKNYPKNTKEGACEKTRS